MTYYFLPGRLFTLSKAELLSVLPLYVKDFTLEYAAPSVIFVKTNSPEADLKQVFERLGGFLGFGKVIDENGQFLAPFMDKEKVTFGVNVYGKVDGFDYSSGKKFCEEIKKNLKANNVAAKYLFATSMVLSAIVVEKEKILERGFLMEIFKANGKLNYGMSLGVQDIESFASLEYDKPYTDKRMGVLPAKLARMMVNLAGLKPNQTLWDPFCGSGTILLEAFKQGIHVIGSDIDSKAVRMSEANIEWLAAKEGNKSTKYKVFKMDILKPDSHILGLLRKTDFDGLVCEPYMGPPALETIGEKRARALLEGVKSLYVALFEILEHSKLSNFNAVIIVPSYRTPRGWMTLSVSDFVGKRWTILNKKWGEPLQWSRSDSIIRRNIFVLSKRN